MNVYQCGYHSPVGELTLSATDQFLYQVEFKKTRHNNECEILKQTKREFDFYFKGRLKQFSIPLFMDGTEFQKKVWKELLNIPYGKTMTYKEQAEKIANKNYVRAVAGANNKNKIPIIIPCHRIIGSDGSLVGYAAGIKVKKYLLAHEV